MQKQTDVSGISVHLGRTSEYKSQYDPDLLVREPRQMNRTHLDIEDDKLPFVGYDTWNAYEVSGLTNDGMPVVGIAKIVYSCRSKYIVESKSLKLYLNTFNMTKLGHEPSEVNLEIEKRVSKDLSKLLDTTVKVAVVSSSHILQKEDVATGREEYEHDEYLTLEDEVYLKDVNQYQEDPKLLVLEESNGQLKCFHSSLLKSNCKVTSQPDWGDVYIRFSGDKQVTTESLLRYIISFRDECHFHEEIAETIYKRLWDLNIFNQLHVMCLYARRGGIDICPERASHEYLLHKHLSVHDSIHVKTSKQ